MEEDPLMMAYAPTDRDAETIGDDGPRPVCVACTYQLEQESEDSFGHEERLQAQGGLLRLIREFRGKGTRPAEIVDALQEYYNTMVRPIHDQGEWSRQAIWEHLLYHENDDALQTNILRDSTMRQYEALRARSWVLDANGQRHPHTATLRLMSELAKTHTQLRPAAR